MPGSQINFGAVKNLVLPPVAQQMRWGFLTYDTADGVIDYNLKYAQQQGMALIPQSIIVNTQDLSGDVTVVWDIDGVAFEVTCPPGIVQSYTVPAVDPPTFRIAPAAGTTGMVRIDMLNFPLIPEAFAVSSGTDVTNPLTAPANVQIVINGNPVSVTNPFFAEISVSGAAVSTTNPLPVEIASGLGEVDTSPLFVELSNGAVPVGTDINPLYTEQVSSLLEFFSGSLTGTGGSVVGPATEPNALRRLRLTISGDAAIAAAGEQTITISYDGTTVFEDTIYMLAAGADNVPSWYVADIDFGSLGLHSTTASADLTLTLGTALSAGVAILSGWFDTIYT